MSKLSLRSGRKKFQPICRCRIRLWALYWVATSIRRMPEFTAFESAKSMMRDFPPKYTAGLARRSVNSIRRLPRPPASTKARACRARAHVGLLASGPPYNARLASSCSACGRARRKESSYPRRSLMHRGDRGSQTNAPARPSPCSSFRRDLSIQPGHTPVATIIGEIDPPLSGTVRTVAVVAGMVLDVAKAAPLPEAKPNDVGFSQQVLARLDLRPRDGR